MALPTTKSGHEVALYIETATPGTYAYVCGIETTELNLEASVIERAIRDCATPHAAPTMVRLPGMKTGSVSGSGLLAIEFEDDLWGAYNGAVAKNFRVCVGPPLTTGSLIYQGAFVVTALNITANADGNSYAEVSISLQSSGAITRTVV